jgi:predicted permease
VTLAAGLLFGLLPAWQVTRGSVGSRLKEQSRGNTGGWGRALVSLQLALSLPLLAGAGLLARTVYNLQHQQLGYPAERLLLVGINSRVAGYNSARSEVLFRDLLAQIDGIPGVQAASFSHNGVFSGSNSGDDVEVEGYTPAGQNDHESAFDMVGAKYFSTLGIPLLLGRDIAERDDAGAPKICVINDAFAKKFFAGRNPIGMHVTQIDIGRRTTFRVAGLSADARTEGLRGTVGPRFYIPIAQTDSDNVKRANFLIRTAAGDTPVLSAVRRAFQRVDPTLPLTYARSMQEEMAPLTAPERTTALLAMVFGGAAVMLAAIGLYGVLAYGITRRTREIAVRIALGAQPGGVIGMILRETAALVAAGLVAGMGLAWAAARLIASQLFGVSPQDPATLAAAVAVLLLVALIAVYLPAKRASRLDPMAALRQE